MNEREARKIRKRKGQLRCDWCNRWTQVNLNLWEAYALDYKGSLKPEYEFYCRRFKCFRHRKELMDVDKDKQSPKGKGSFKKRDTETNTRKPTRDKVESQRRPDRPSPKSESPRRELPKPQSIST
jgi:hypothetical protein